MTFFDEVMGWSGKRVRYMSSGVSATQRITLEAFSVEAPVRIVVEGEVSGAQSGSYRPIEVNIAGYGWVPADQCELIGDRPEFDPETGWADQDVVPLLQELLGAFAPRGAYEMDAADLERRIRLVLALPREDGHGT